MGFEAVSLPPRVRYIGSYEVEENYVLEHIYISMALPILITRNLSIRSVNF